MSWFDFDFPGGSDSSGGGSSSDWNYDWGGNNGGDSNGSDWSQGSGNAMSSNTGGYDLSSLFSGLKDGINTFNKYGGSTLVKGGLAAYDAYQRNQNAKALQPQINALNNMYQPGSPEALQMQKELDARDAAAGRRSQYGTRSVELNADLAKQRAGILTSPGYLNLQSARMGSTSGAYKGLGDFFGELSKTNFADGGLVGGSGTPDDSDIQWKGTENGLGAHDLTFLSQYPTGGNGNGDTTIPLGSWSSKFDTGPKSTPDPTPKNPYNDPTLPSDDDLQSMAQNAGYNPNGDQVANAVTGQGDATLADFWQGGGNTGGLGQAIGSANTLNTNTSWQSQEQALYDAQQAAYNSIGSFSNAYGQGGNGKGGYANSALQNYIDASDAYKKYVSTAPTGVTPGNWSNYNHNTNAPADAYRTYTPNPLASSQWNSSYVSPVSSTGVNYGSNAAAQQGNMPGGISFGGFNGSGGGGSSLQLSNGSMGSYFADGGHIPGHDLTGRDDFKANLTRGEYVLPVRVVDAIGKDKLDQLVDMYNKPKGRR
jgi:hypothetical protein